MSRSSVLILFGILIMITPFSGLPISLRSLLSVIFGACVLGMGIAIRTAQVRKAQGGQTLVTAEQASPKEISVN